MTPLKFFRTRRQRAVILGVVVLCVAVVGVWWSAQQRTTVRDDSISSEELNAPRLLERKHFAVASLENMPNDQTNDGAECVAALSEISEQLPDDPLGPRNLVVARLLILENLIAAQHADQIQPAWQAAEAAIETARARDGDQLSLQLLLARLMKLGVSAGLIDDPQQVVEAFLAATRMSPDDPLVWSEMYVATRDLFDEPSQAANHDALRRAWELRQDNLVLLTEWLMVQAEKSDPMITRTLAVASRVLQPLAPAIAQRGVELDSSIEAALAAAESTAEDAQMAVLSAVRPLVFVVRPDPAYQLDRPRLERHPLEYVIHDFGDEFYDQAKLPEQRTASEIPVRFVTLPEHSRLPTASVVRDILLADYNLDGRLDVIRLTEAGVDVLTQEPDNNSWHSLAAVSVDPGMNRLAAADLDRDDDLDLIVFGLAGVSVLNNQRDDPQLLLSGTPLVAALETLVDVRAVAIADLEHDGDLDLVVSSRTGLSLWSNHGEFLFADVSDQSTLPAIETTVSAIVPVDWNRDVAIDLIIAGTPPAEIAVLENVFHNRFRSRAIEMPPLGIRGPLSVAVADVDGNASWDLVVGGEQGISVVRTETFNNGRIQFHQAESVIQAATDGLKTWDYNNDGATDIVAWGAAGLHVHRGTADGQYDDVSDVFPDLSDAVHACDVGDLDGDGDTDLAIVAGGRVSCLINEGGNANHWIDITLRAESDPKLPSQRTNSYGVGSLLELKSGSIYQAQIASRQSTHFGLGQRDGADVLRVLFTNGIPQNVLAPVAGQQIIAEQRILKGSCPYLYTWTGERYEFFTDLLWASPIGLQFAEGVLAVPREWEFLLIPGSRLIAQDDEYRLQITEELWEAAYFDQLRLIAVDHPADVQVYSNEKVGPAEIAGFGIHTVSSPQRMVAAHDEHGRDVLPLIADRDDVYLRAWDQRMTQGLTEQQAIDLDLGEWDDPERFTLFLTGWVFPTDTSLNVAISQNPAMPRPQPPSLWVPDAEGRWIQAIPYTGFPGGKTKTIAIELSADMFVNGDYRVRLTTNMELCWDEIFFTVDEPSSEYRLTELQPVSADLHHRGFSRRIEHPGNGPESYDYDDVSTEPRWPPMRGGFTRYGDVTDLIRHADDALVVLGAGDEMTVRFPVPADPPPDGWTRDFLLHNIGWDKDADLNTVLGQTVEPLPFRSMQSYPYRADVSRPDTPRYHHYLQTRQTREQSRERFWKWVHQATGQWSDAGSAGEGSR